MRITLLILIAVCTISLYGQNNNSTTKELKYFDSGTLIFERIFPACKDYNAAGVPNFNAFGLEGDFLTITRGQWKWKQRLSGTLGGKETIDVIPDIEFEGGYKGGLSFWSNRFSASLGTVVAFQPNPKLEIGIPILFTARYTSNVGRYYLYDGQDVNEADIVEGYEAGTANKVIIDRKLMPGLKTGLEIIGFPNSNLSILGRFNYQYFGWRDVYDISTARLVNGDVEVQSDRVWSTPEWGFTIGMRYYFIRYTKRKVNTKHNKKDKDEPVILDPKQRQK